MECRKSLQPEREVCPACGARGCCRIHAYYGRGLDDCVSSEVNHSDLTVVRLICLSCNHTHAVLADPIIPYRRHSLFFILWALAFQLVLKRTAEQVSEYMGISVRTFHRWKRLYKEHMAEWLGLLRAQETSLRESLWELVRRRDPFSEFASSFFKRAGVSFLQSHKNPSHSRRSAKSPNCEFP